MAQKRTEHTIDPGDIELGQMEFRTIMGDSWDHLDMLTAEIFCMCGSPEKRLIDYTPYLTTSNDIVLRGKCSGCNTIASRYIETGEDPESAASAKRIRTMKKKKKYLLRKKPNSQSLSQESTDRRQKLPPAPASRHLVQG